MGKKLNFFQKRLKIFENKKIMIKNPYDKIAKIKRRFIHSLESYKKKKSIQILKAKPSCIMGKRVIIII